MNSLITTLPPPSSSSTARAVLSQDGYQASVITLPAGGEFVLDVSHNSEDELLFVVDGEATLHVGDASNEVNTMLAKDQAVRLPKNQPHVIVARGDRTAKILRVSVPPRQVIIPPIESFAR
jgi:mannose-6-phosphate isomerase-like protein (cupin superfamily)